MTVGRELFEQDLRLALAAAANAYKRKRFVVVGSAAILATFPDAPSFLRLSADIGDWTMLSQPEGWFERCVQYSTTGQIDGDDVTVDGYALHPLDLAYNKLEAGRDKDLNFVGGLISEDLICLEKLEKFIKGGCPHEELLPAIIKNLDKIKAVLK